MEWRWLSLQAPPPTHPLIRSLCVKRGANNGRRIKGSFIRGPYKQLSLWILRKWTAGQMNLSKTVWCLRRDTYEGLHQIDGNSHKKAETQYNTDIERFEMGGRRRMRANVGGRSGFRCSCCVLPAAACLGPHQTAHQILPPNHDISFAPAGAL